ncbi:MAG TPA: HIRAN domain-containing protein [Terracidiphilus sp.]|jgi:hypothetical protein
MLVGFSHPNKHGLNRLDLVRKLSRGSKLVLVPEPENPVDRNAILVYSADDLENDLGYLDATGAKKICRMIECGAAFTADLAFFWGRDPDFPTVYIYVYQLTPMQQAHRPIRKDAPEYKRPLPKWIAEKTERN